MYQLDIKMEAIDMSDLFLLNLERIFIYIRSDLKRSENRQIIILVLNVIENLQCSNEELCLCMNSYMELYNTTMTSDVHNEELSERFVFRQFLKETLYYLLILIDNKEYEKIYDVIDILHVVPNVVSVNKKTSKKDFYKIYIKKFSKKWNDKFFLRMKHYFK